MTDQYPGVIPMIAYADGSAAMDWLAAVFGFRQRDRRVGIEGRLEHGEMATDHGLVMMATPSLHYQGPKQHREACAIAASWHDVPYIIDGYLVYVDDIDEHFARAKAGGARILSELEGGENGKRYRAEDLEGHRWMFMASRA